MSDAEDPTRTLQVLPTAHDAAHAAASAVANTLGAVLESGPSRLASVAFSGGSSPRPMLALLATEPAMLADGRAHLLDWSRIDVLQVDERVAPDGDPARNLVDLRSELTDRAVPAERVHAMPVELGAEAAATAYEELLVTLLGPSPRIDVVHLGLGDDGHCASLVPGDPALGELERSVTSTGDYQGHRRVTMTYPTLDRAGTIVWLVTGTGKAAALAALMSGDRSIPASRVMAQQSIVVADTDAASML